MSDTPIPPSQAVPPEHRAELEKFPAALRELILDELAAGNSIVEVGHSFPAPPAGAYVKLARVVSTRPRKADGVVDFYERNSSSYLGEFTEGNRFFWVLEPPAPEPPYPDMDAIRAANAPAPFVPQSERTNPDRDAGASVGDVIRSVLGVLNDALTDGGALQRFMNSMQIDYEKWHDGIGYDLDALRALTPQVQHMLEQKMTPPNGWRDVEALAVINSPSARETLRKAINSTDLETRMAVLSNAPDLIDDTSRINALVDALSRARPFDGLTQTLDEIMAFHPPIIVDALWAGLLRASNDSAYHFAATLAALGGVIDSRYDWSMRPLFLQFVTPEMSQRRRAFLELCTRLGEDGALRLANAEQFSHMSFESDS